MPLIEEILAEHEGVDKRYRREKSRWKSDAEEFRVKSLSRIFHEGTRINETTFDFPFNPEVFDGGARKESYGFNNDTGALISAPGYLFLIDGNEKYIRVNDETLQEQSIQKVRWFLDTDIIELNRDFEGSVRRLHKLTQMLTRKDPTRIGYFGKEWRERDKRPYHVKLLEDIPDIVVNGEQINDNTFFYKGPHCLFIPEDNTKANLDFEGRENQYRGFKMELSSKGSRIPVRELNNCYKEVDGVILTVDTKKVDIYRSVSFTKKLRRYDKILSGKETGAITYSIKCPWSPR